MPKGNLYLLAALLLGLLWGCETNRLKVQRLNPPVNPVDMITRLKQDMAEARQEQVPLLSPTTFSESEGFLLQAEEGMKRGETPSETLLKVSYAQVRLDKARSKARQTGALLAEVIMARDLAREAGVDVRGGDYRDAEEGFFSLIEAAEADRMERVKKDSPAVRDAYSRLELREIGNRTLGEARSLFAQAEREGAPRIVPKSFAATKLRLQGLEAEVSPYRHDKQRLGRISKDALFATNRLLQLRRESERIRTMKPEEIALWFEEALEKATKGVSASDMRDRGFDAQVQNLLESISSVRSRQQILSDRLKIQQENLDEMEKELAGKGKKQTAEEGK